MLGRALGKIFFSKKKQPIPLKIGQILGKGDPSTVAKRIIAAREKTYLYRNHGNCVTIRIAKTNFKPSQVRSTRPHKVVSSSMVDMTLSLSPSIYPLPFFPFP